MSDPLDFDEELPSKSELKRQSRDLQDLGDELVALPPAEFDALPLPEDVRDAIVAARRITSHGARLRQKLYIGKLLRRIDVEPVREALAAAVKSTASGCCASGPSRSGVTGCSRTTRPPGRN